MYIARDGLPTFIRCCLCGSDIDDQGKAGWLLALWGFRVAVLVKAGRAHVSDGYCARCRRDLEREWGLATQAGEDRLGAEAYVTRPEGGTD